MAAITTCDVLAAHEWKLAMRALGDFIVHGEKHLDLAHGHSVFDGYNSNAELARFLARCGFKLVPITEAG